MDKETVVRAMGVEDLPAVLQIQSLCHEAANLEPEASFLAKLTASPATCFMAMVGESPAGYLVAVPSRSEAPPPLHSPVYAVPSAPDSLYLHDLAVHPRARGSGVAGMLIGAYFDRLQRQGLAFACLTAVNGSSAYWARYGFRVVAPGSADAARLATYGEGARYMRRPAGEITAAPAQGSGSRPAPG